MERQHIEIGIVILGSLENQPPRPDVQVATSPEGKTFVGDVSNEGMAEAQTIHTIVLKESVER
jgi:hypothetical protein